MLLLKTKKQITSREKPKIIHSTNKSSRKMPQNNSKQKTVQLSSKNNYGISTPKDQAQTKQISLENVDDKKELSLVQKMTLMSPSSVEEIQKEKEDSVDGSLVNLVTSGTFS